MAMSDPDYITPFLKAQTNQEIEAAERRAVERAYYIRQHAPTILAGLLSRPGYELEMQKAWDTARAAAQVEAGRLFDETEYQP